VGAGARRVASGGIGLMVILRASDFILILLMVAVAGLWFGSGTL
jgi:hypothetical protein